MEATVLAQECRINHSWRGIWQWSDKLQIGQNKTNQVVGRDSTEERKEDAGHFSNERRGHPAWFDDARWYTKLRIDCELWLTWKQIVRREEKKKINKKYGRKCRWKNLKKDTAASDATGTSKQIRTAFAGNWLTTAIYDPRWLKLSPELILSRQLQAVGNKLFRRIHSWPSWRKITKEVQA
jgi:hypothetical protein